MNLSYEIKTKTYLDEIPELYTSIASYLNDLDLDSYGSGCENFINDLECRRRDGFIPHGHNHGGFDVYNCHSSTFECVCDEADVPNCQCESEILLHGFRLMYEGEANGIHTICIYYSQWHEDDVYGIGRARTLVESEIKFKTTEALIAKLNRFINKTINSYK